MSTQETWAQRLVAAAVADAVVVISVSTGSAPADGTHWGAPRSPQQRREPGLTRRHLLGRMSRHIRRSYTSAQSAWLTEDRRFPRRT